jgi:hypothetical protein
VNFTTSIENLLKIKCFQMIKSEDYVTEQMFYNSKKNNEKISMKIEYSSYNNIIYYIPKISYLNSIISILFKSHIYNKFLLNS